MRAIVNQGTNPDAEIYWKSSDITLYLEQLYGVVSGLWETAFKV